MSAARHAGLALIALNIALSCQSAIAQSDLKGRQIQVIIGGGVGGAIDAVARTFVPYLARHLTGEPTAVQSNMGGNGGAQAAQYLFNVAAKDGTSIVMVNAGPVSDPLMRGTQLGYDPRRFGWIGSLQRGDTVCSVWHTSAVKTVEDARRREVPFASAGASSTPHRSALLVNAIAGTRFKPIPGFDGGTALLALERGEVDGICNQLASQRTTRPQWLKEGKLKPIVFLAMTGDPEFPDVPRVFDLISEQGSRQMLEFYLLPWEFNHSFMLPPGVADSTLAAWRAAFDKAVKEPGYLADAEKRLQKIAARGGAEVQGLVDKLYETPKEVVDRTIAATSAVK